MNGKAGDARQVFAIFGWFVAQTSQTLASILLDYLFCAFLFYLVFLLFDPCRAPLSFVPSLFVLSSSSNIKHVIRRRWSDHSTWQWYKRLRAAQPVARDKASHYPESIESPEAASAPSQAESRNSGSFHGPDYA